MLTTGELDAITDRFTSNTEKPGELLNLIISARSLLTAYSNLKSVQTTTAAALQTAEYKLDLIVDLVKRKDVVGLAYEGDEW